MSADGPGGLAGDVPRGRPPATTWRPAPARSCSRPTPGVISRLPALASPLGMASAEAAVARFDATEATVPGPLAPDKGPLPAAQVENVLAYPALGAEQVKV